MSAAGLLRSLVIPAPGIPTLVGPWEGSPGVLGPVCWLGARRQDRSLLGPTAGGSPSGLLGTCMFLCIIGSAFLTKTWNSAQPSGPRGWAQVSLPYGLSLELGGMFVRFRRRGLGF